MNNRRFYFVSGLPRSGSTLLCNILAQNPEFHATATSGIMDVMFGVRNQWDQLVEFRANPNSEAKKRVLRAILESYYADVEQPVVFDKSRGWLSLLEMAEEVLGTQVKVLAPVRDLRDVLASFEKLWRNTSRVSQVVQERDHYFAFQSIEGRMQTWLKPDQPVGLAYNRLKDVFARGLGDRVLLVDFDDLTRDPHNVLSVIYDFLEEKKFDHDFKHVKQVTWENDAVHGIQGLHDIRSTVEPMKPQWPDVLGDFAERYGSMNFWKH